MTNAPAASRYAILLPRATRASPSRKTIGSAYSGGMTTAPLRSIIPCLPATSIGNSTGDGGAPDAEPAMVIAPRTTMAKALRMRSNGCRDGLLGTRVRQRARSSRVCVSTAMLRDASGAGKRRGLLAPGADLERVADRRPGLEAGAREHEHGDLVRADGAVGEEARQPGGGGRRGRLHVEAAASQRAECVDDLGLVHGDDRAPA